MLPLRSLDWQIAWLNFQLCSIDNPRKSLYASEKCTCFSLLSGEGSLGAAKKEYIGLRSPEGLKKNLRFETLMTDF
jgi:hypothetical protein